MFIGYPRSGHSLTGALLNAHPEIVLAHELDALEMVRRGCSRSELFSMLLQRDRWFTQNGSRWYEFNYQVPGQFQGSFQRLTVVGDKKGGTSAAYLVKDPQLLRKLREVVQLPMRFIHVTRNPFDNIATLARRREWPLEQAARFYFDLAGSNEKILATLPPEEVFSLRHEDFVMNPREHLGQLLHFLGVQANEKYLADCAAIVFESPRKSRLSTEWPSELREYITAETEKKSPAARVPF